MYNKDHFLFPDNYAWTLSAMSSLNWAGTFHEVFPLCQSLQEASTKGDREAWHDGWNGLAKRVLSLAEEYEEQKRYFSAGETYNRASAYFFSGERLLKAKSEERVAMVKKSHDAFQKYIKYRKPPMEWVSFPYEDTYLNGYFIPAIGVDGPTPCVVYMGGLDTSTEWLASLAVGLDMRGMSCLAVDGPGWGMALKVRGLTTRYDYEVVGRAAVDYLETRQDVDSKRLGIVALSLGGYYAPRVAAFEKRFKAGATLGACWDAQDVFRKLLGKGHDPSQPVSSDKSQAPWVYGVDTVGEALEAMENFKLEGVAQKITIPFLVVHGEHDIQVPLWHAEKTYEALGSKDKRLKIYYIDGGIGGFEHCQWDNQILGKQEIYDFFIETL